MNLYSKDFKLHYENARWVLVSPLNYDAFVVIASIIKPTISWGVIHNEADWQKIISTQNLIFARNKEDAIASMIIVINKDNTLSYFNSLDSEVFIPDINSFLGVSKDILLDFDYSTYNYSRLKNYCSLFSSQQDGIVSFPQGTQKIDQPFLLNTGLKLIKVPSSVKEITKETYNKSLLHSNTKIQYNGSFLDFLKTIAQLNTYRRNALISNLITQDFSSTHGLRTGQWDEDTATIRILEYDNIVYNPYKFGYLWETLSLPYKVDCYLQERIPTYKNIIPFLKTHYDKPNNYLSKKYTFNSIKKIIYPGTIAEWIKIMGYLVTDLSDFSSCCVTCNNGSFKYLDHCKITQDNEYQNIELGQKLKVIPSNYLSGRHIGILVLSSSIKFISCHAFNNSTIREVRYNGTQKSFRSLFHKRNPIISSATIHCKDGDIQNMLDMRIWSKSKGILTFPMGNMYLSENQFLDCSFLSKLTINAPISSVPKGCCDGCVNLEEVILASSVTSIKSDAFKSSGLKRIIAPAVKRVNMNAFAFCDNLKKLDMPSLEVLSLSILTDCNLESLTLSNKLKRITPASFVSLKNIQKIYFRGTPSELRKVTNNTEFLSKVTYLS